MPCWHICWPDGQHNTVASIACLTTIAHLTSIASSLAFGTPCPSPLILKVPLCLISSLLPMHMFHFSCCSSLFTDNFAPHLLSQNLNVICLALQIAAVLARVEGKVVDVVDSADVVDMVVVVDAVSAVQDFSQSKHLHPSCVSHSISPLDNTLRSTLLIPLTLRPLSQCSPAQSAYKFLSIRSQFTELTSLPVIIVRFPIASQVLSRAPICALPT